MQSTTTCQCNVKADFFYTMRVSPDGELKDFKVMDEVRRPMQLSVTPVETTTEVIKMFHGPFGGSTQLHNIINAVAGSDRNLRKAAADTKQAANVVNSSILSLGKVSGLINQNIVCSNMDIPFLRFFITECQVLHPDITAEIQERIEEFPYFKEVSEQIGMHLTIIADCNQLDPIYTLDCENLPNDNIRTSARMIRLLFYKMFITIYGMIEDAESFLDCLMLRAMPYEENQGFLNPNYSEKGPMAHGNNHANDVFHLDREVEAIPEVLKKLVEMFKDRLRLLNQIFPITFLVKIDEEVFEVDIEGTKRTVNRLNIIKEDTNRTNETLKARRERFEKEQDDAGEKE